MSHRNSLSFASGLAVILLVMGCQGNPAVPQAVPDGEAQPHAAAAAQPHHCLGYYGLIIDTEGLDISVVPMRSAEWHFNVTGIMNSTMGLSAVGVPSQHDPPHGLFVFDITLTHPFGGKPQFSGFDVKGILMTPGTLAVGPLLFADADETCLENADGYTRWWNPTEFTKPGIFGYTKGVFANASAGALTATVNPYKLFADRLGAEDSLSWVTGEPLDSDLGRAVFKAASSNTRRYRIRFPMNPGPQVVYGYAIDAAWSLPSPNPPAEVPDDFPIAANQPEAYRIGLVPILNSLYYDSESGTGGGALRLQVNVHDWQGQLTGDFAWEIDDVRVYAPGLMAGGVDGVYLDDTADKRRFTADIIGLAEPDSSGETKVVCRVGSADGSTYQQTGAPAPDSTLSAFHAVTVNVVDPDCTADTNNDFGEAVNLDLDQPTIDQLCAPTDDRDFYRFEIPQGYEISGKLLLYCDVEPTTFGFYDGTTLIFEVSVSGGKAAIDLSGWLLLPATYYVRVLTQSSDVAFLYAIEPDVELVDVTPTNPQLVTPPGLYFAPRWVTVDGDMAYATGTWGFWIIQYPYCTTPQLLSYLEIGYSPLCDPAYSYPYVYRYRVDADVTYVDVVDVSDPHNPVLHNAVCNMSPVEASCIHAEADWLYLGLPLSPTSIISVWALSQNPLAPQAYTSFNLNGSPKQLEMMHDQADTKDWLMVRYDTPRIDMFDVTDEDAIVVSDFIEWAPGGQIVDMTPQGDYLYLLRYHPSGTFYFEVFLVNDSGIDFKGSLEWPVGRTPVCLTCEGNYAYVANDDTTSCIVDITDPTSPGDPDCGGSSLNSTNDVDSDGDLLLFVMENAGVRTTNIGTPGQMFNCGKVLGLGMPDDLTISGDYMYAGEHLGYSAVKTVDISDPPNAGVVGELVLDPSSSAFFIRASQGRMVSSGWMTTKIDLIDCSDPENLQYLDSVNAAGSVYDVLFYANRLYVSCSSPNVLEIWDISNWPTISLYWSMAMTSPAITLVIKDAVLYMISNYDILIYSLANPDSPAYVGTYFPLADAWEMVVRGDYLYIATSGTLEIADISIPQSPTFAASAPHPDAPNGRYVAVENQFAYLQPMGADPPTVMRVWPPDDPVVIGDLYPDTDYMPYQILVHNGFYYERDFIRAVRIWDLY